MNVLKEFQAAINIEHEKNLKNFEEQMRLPLDERVAKGVTMSNLRVEFGFYEYPPNQFCPSIPDRNKFISSAKIFCDNNISKFKEGSPVILSNGNYRFEMEIYEDSLDNFTLQPNDFTVSDCYINMYEYPNNNWEINEAKSDATRKMLSKTVEVLQEDMNKLLKIENFLNGQTINKYTQLSARIEYLNSSQHSALNKAINCSDFCIVQGPPGTGKTETIANIAKSLIEQGLKVFITAPTHAAINNCLNTISTRVKNKGQIVKIGNKAQNKEIANNEHITIKSSLQYPTYQRSSDLSQNGIAIGATPYSVCYDATKKLRFWEFDVCIVDEASQLSIPLSIAAMSRSKKWIFVGDHKQLDPIIPKGSNNEMFAESIFRRLARIYPNEINLLNTSYRLNKSLITIPNTLFYENLLLSASSTQEDSSQYQCNYHSEILNSDAHKLILHNVFDAQGRSPFEAKLVAELVSDLLQNGVKLNDIGIMSPYRAQVREIKKEIRKVLPRTISKPFEILFIDTVDSMQGQERNYIIYSLANSHPLESMRRLDFFYSPNRLNVAITRAIRKCLVIANYKVFDIIDDELKGHKEYQGIKDNLDVFKEYYSLSSKIEIIETEPNEW
jgi:DNA replication ATP-dependent helicase Dna2